MCHQVQAIKGTTNKRDELRLRDMKLERDLRLEMLSATVLAESLRRNLAVLLSKVKMLTTLERSDLEALMRQATYVHDQSTAIDHLAASLETRLASQEAGLWEASK